MRRKYFAPLFLLLCVGASSALAADDEKKMTGDEIVAKHLEAAGGKDALARFKSRIALGTVKKENEPEGQLAVMSETPNRLSVYYGFRDYSLRMVYNGESAFLRPALPRQTSNLTDKYQDMLASGLMFNSMSLYNLITTSAPGALKFEAKGTKKVKGRQAYVVQFKPAKGAAMKLYFDAENFMWVRTDYGKASLSKEMSSAASGGGISNDVVNQGGSELTVDFYIETSDFRDVDGVKLPFRFEQVITSPILRQSTTGTIVGVIREYRHNAAIDPKMFQ